MEINSRLIKGGRKRKGGKILFDNYRHPDAKEKKESPFGFHTRERASLFRETLKKEMHRGKTGAATVVPAARGQDLAKVVRARVADDADSIYIGSI